MTDNILGHSRTDGKRHENSQLFSGTVHPVYALMVFKSTGKEYRLGAAQHA